MIIKSGIENLGPPTTYAAVEVKFFFVWITQPATRYSEAQTDLVVVIASGKPENWKIARSLSDLTQTEPIPPEMIAALQDPSRVRMFDHVGAAANAITFPARPTTSKAVEEVKRPIDSGDRPTIQRPFTQQ